MSLSKIIILLITVLLLSVGQILFKLASNELVLNKYGFIPSLLSFKLLIALTVYGFATVLWLISLKDTPLNLAYPFVALAFFIVPVFSHYLLGESFSSNTFVGALIIAVEVSVSVFK